MRHQKSSSNSARTAGEQLCGQGVDTVDRSLHQIISKPHPPISIFTTYFLGPVNPVLVGPCANLRWNRLGSLVSWFQGTSCMHYNYKKPVLKNYLLVIYSIISLELKKQSFPLFEFQLGLSHLPGTPCRARRFLLMR